MSETRELAAILVAKVVGCSRLAGVNDVGAFARLRGPARGPDRPAIAAAHHRRTANRSIIEYRSVTTPA
jgi:adenylate cyclase